MDLVKWSAATDATSPVVERADAITAWARSFEAQSGFEVRALDIGPRTFRLEVSRGDAVITADIDSIGRCTLVEERRERYTQRVGRKGDAAIVERVRMVLVERLKPDGPRSMLRALAARTGARESVRMLIGPALDRAHGAA